MIFLAVRVIGRKKGGVSRNCSREIVSPPHSCHCVCVLYELNEVVLIHNSLLTKSYKEYGGSLSKVEKLATGGIFSTSHSVRRCLPSWIKGLTRLKYFEVF